MSMCFALQQTKLCLGMLLAHVFFGKRLWMLTARRRWLKYVLVIAISVVALLGLSFVRFICSPLERGGLIVREADGSCASRD